jgi:hypothetical protein
MLFAREPLYFRYSEGFVVLWGSIYGKLSIYKGL